VSDNGRALVGWDGCSDGLARPLESQSALESRARAPAARNSVMQLNPHLSFNGDCQGALEFYEKCLGGKITLMMPYEGSPVADHVPAAWRHKILHSELSIGDDRLTAADAPPGRYEKPQGFSVTLNIEGAADAER